MGQIAVTRRTQLPLTDCEELNDLSRQVGWDTQYTQLDAGPLEGRFTMAMSQTLRQGHPTTNKSLIIRGTPPPDSLAVILPLGPGSRGIFQGEALGEGQVAIMCPNSEGYYRTPPDNSFLSVCIALSYLYPALEAASEHPVEACLGSTRIISTTPTTARHLRALLQRAATVGQASGPIELQELESAFAGAIARHLVSPVEKTPRRISQRRQVFLLAREYIEANMAAPLRLEILAGEVGVSLRTLRYSFQQVLGINPWQYIKLRRLTATHMALQRAHPDSATVTEIAMRCGFSHMSYFARDYRKQFDEFPAQTLALPPETTCTIRATTTPDRI